MEADRLDQPLHVRAVCWRTCRAGALAFVALALGFTSAPVVAASPPSDSGVPVAAPLDDCEDDEEAEECDGEGGDEGDDDDEDDDDEDHESDWGDDDTNQTRRAVREGKWLAERDLGSLYSLTRRIGAQAAWRKGYTGKGVTVAVIDTGVARVAGLKKPGKVVNGPDLSYEGQAAGTRYLDGFGHGTHMAGIVAGRDAGLDTDEKVNPRLFTGVAPGASILNMKVATGDGGADVTSVIAAIDWVVQHRNDEDLNVRVISLSYGTNSTQGADVDPLAHAVQNAWRHGIVVVAAAGNDGAADPSLLMPAADPYVIAVGAVDHLGTSDTADDVVADFSNPGDNTRRPDVLAPGKSVVSLRVPNSYVDQLYPEGRIPEEKRERFVRGSGTSQATAAVAGAVALLLEQRPDLTPDQVKALLRRSGERLAVANPAQGAGVIDVAAALQTRTPRLDAVRQTWPASTGLGSLDAARGGEHVIDPAAGTVLAGELDALGDPFDAAAWAAESRAGRAWRGGRWGTRAWTGTEWTRAGYAPVAWTGDSWGGLPWSAHLWSEAFWRSGSWADTSLLARSWRGGTWEARSWREDSWVARSWRSDSWVARSWRTTP